MFARLIDFRVDWGGLSSIASALAMLLCETAEFLYKTTDYYAPAHERCLAWNDPTVGVLWPLQGAPALSAKDQLGQPLAQAECFT